MLAKMVTHRPPPEGWLDVGDDITNERLNVTKEMFMDIIRTAMKVIGGMVLATGAAKAGGLTADSWATLSAAALVAGSFVWSLWSTYHFTK